MQNFIWLQEFYDPINLINDFSQFYLIDVVHPISEITTFFNLNNLFYQNDLEHAFVLVIISLVNIGELLNGLAHNFILEILENFDACMVVYNISFR